MEKPLHILLISGSLRTGSTNIAVLKATASDPERDRLTVRHGVSCFGARGLPGRRPSCRPCGLPDRLRAGTPASSSVPRSSPRARGRRAAPRVRPTAPSTLSVAHAGQSITRTSPRTPIGCGTTSVFIGEPRTQRSSPIRRGNRAARKLRAQGMLRTCRALMWSPTRIRKVWRPRVKRCPARGRMRIRR